MSDLSLREYFAERIDAIHVMELTGDDGSVDYAIRIDGTYYGKLASEGMFEYHRNLLEEVLRAEGLC